MNDPLEEKARRLQGPVLILGASGFIGANLLRQLLKVRNDVVGTFFHAPAWRLEGLPPENLRQVDLLVEANLDALLADTVPKTVLDCTAYGAYSFETDSALIHRTNFTLAENLLRRLLPLGIAAYVHAGSSSEYGDNATKPAEDELPAPNSDYAVSKVAAANLIGFYGKRKGLPCANLRLYSVYGPLEDSSRLIPNLVRAGKEGRYPELADPSVTRDFVYIDDCCEAFLDTALGLRPEHYGESFNIGSGKKTSLADAAKAAQAVFDLKEAPRFGTLPNRAWDTKDWYADPRKAKKALGWEARTAFRDGLAATKDWFDGLEDPEAYRKASKQFELDSKHSVSIVVSCYRDAATLPELHERLKAVLERLGVDHEILLVDDGSGDGTGEVIRELTRKDRRVVGVTHSRSFGSNAAFRSGLELATKNACVLMEGNLQDPPELIESFVGKWREGFDVVFGRLTKRADPLLVDLAYKAFFKVFNHFSATPIPPGSGDFSLIDRQVVAAILRFPERDLFLRGIRAFVGFRQTGVDYIHPPVFRGRERSFWRKVALAKGGILGFSYTPLAVLTLGATLLFLLGLTLAVVQLGLRIFFPALTPKGATTVLLAILLFGSLNLFALAILGEYIGRIFEEVKHRPRSFRRTWVKDGQERMMGPGPVDKN